eukprot:gene11237-7807_t
MSSALLILYPPELCLCACVCQHWAALPSIQDGHKNVILLVKPSALKFDELRCCSCIPSIVYLLFLNVEQKHKHIRWAEGATDPAAVSLAQPTRSASHPAPRRKGEGHDLRRGERCYPLFPPFLSLVSMLPLACAAALAFLPPFSLFSLLNMTERQNSILPDILAAVGQTPCVRLNRIPQAHGVECEMVAKCEFLNPGGSVKDRIARQMIENAEKEGKLKPGSVLVEATSGNTGIGLSMAAAVRGYHMVITMPKKMSHEKEVALKALGAEVIRTETSLPSEHPDSLIGMAKRLVEEKGYVCLNQYTNPGNYEAHLKTGEEIWNQCGGRIDMVVLTTGTGGTMTGVAKFLKSKDPNIEVVGVDPVGSILADPSAPPVNQPYQVEGIGYDFVPDVCHRQYVDRWIKSRDTESFQLAKELHKSEGLLIGGSSGSALYGALEAAKSLKKGQRCVVLFADGIRNYMAKFADPNWMIEKGFETGTIERPTYESLAAELAETKAKLAKLEGKGAHSCDRLLRAGPTASILTTVLKGFFPASSNRCKKKKTTTYFYSFLAEICAMSSPNRNSKRNFPYRFSCISDTTAYSTPTYSITVVMQQLPKLLHSTLRGILPGIPVVFVYACLWRCFHLRKRKGEHTGRENSDDAYVELQPAAWGTHTYFTYDQRSEVCGTLGFTLRTQTETHMPLRLLHEAGRIVGLQGVDVLFALVFVMDIQFGSTMHSSRSLEGPFSCSLSAPSRGVVSYSAGGSQAASGDAGTEDAEDLYFGASQSTAGVGKHRPALEYSSAPCRFVDPTAGVLRGGAATVNGGGIPKDWIRLNIGGERVVTTHLSMRVEPGSVLEAMSRLATEGSPLDAAAALVGLDRDEEGFILLDVDMLYFRPILNYLRHGRFSLPPNVDVAGVRALADQLRLRRLARLLRPPSCLLAWGPSEAGEFGVGKYQHHSGCALASRGATDIAGVALYVPVEVPIARRSQRAGLMGGDRVVQVSLGLQFTCVRTDAGEVFTFGEGHWGQLGLGPELTSVDRPQRVSYFGPDAAYTAAHIACGYTCAMAVSRDHHVLFWGNNNHGQSALGPQLFCEGSTKIFSPVLVEALEPTAGRHIIEVDCGSFFGVALSAEGRVYSWGVADCLGLGVDWRRRAALCPGAASVSLTKEHRDVLLHPVEVEFPSSGPGEAAPTVAVRAGQWHCCAINKAGEVFTWGVGFQGRLGHGSLDAAWTPQRVIGGGLAGHRVVGASCGSFHTAVVTEDGSLYCWGDNSHKQCGALSSVPLTLPSRVAELDWVGSGEAVDVACGRHHTVVVVKGPHPDPQRHPNRKTLGAWSDAGFAMSGDFPAERQTGRLRGHCSQGQPQGQPFLIGAGGEFESFAKVLEPIFSYDFPPCCCVSGPSNSLLRAGGAEASSGSGADQPAASPALTTRKASYPIRRISGFSAYNVVQVFTGHGPTFFVAEDARLQPSYKKEVPERETELEIRRKSEDYIYTLQCIFLFIIIIIIIIIILFYCKDFFFLFFYDCLCLQDHHLLWSFLYRRSHSPYDSYEGAFFLSSLVGSPDPTFFSVWCRTATDSLIRRRSIPFKPTHQSRGAERSDRRTCRRRCPSKPALRTSVLFLKSIDLFISNSSKINIYIYIYIPGENEIGAGSLLRLWSRDSFPLSRSPSLSESSGTTGANSSIPPSSNAGGVAPDPESPRTSGSTASLHKGEGSSTDPSTNQLTPMMNYPKGPNSGPGAPIANPLVTPPGSRNNNIHGKQQSKSATSIDRNRIAAIQERLALNPVDTTANGHSPTTNGSDRQRSVVVPTPPWAMPKKCGGGGPPFLRRVYQNNSRGGATTSGPQEPPNVVSPHTFQNGAGTSPNGVNTAPPPHPQLQPESIVPVKKQRPPEEDELSDISNSDTASSPSSRASQTGQRSPRRYSATYAGLWGHKGDELEQERNRMPLSIEEDLFVYDDIVISKDEARTKHWRLAGRKGGLETSSTSSGSTAGSSFTMDDSGNKISFLFNDFDICVDEMEVAPSTTSSALAREKMLTSLETSTPRDLSEARSDFSVTWTQQRRQPSSPSLVPPPLRAERPIRNFKCASLRGHAARVKCISISPSEKEFVSCSNEDASVRRCSLAVGDDVGIFTAHTETVICTAFSPDGKLLATTSKDRTMQLWDAGATKRLIVYPHPKVVICCCFSPDGRLLVSGCQDRVCRIWDTRRIPAKKWLEYSQHEGIVISVAYSPDGNYVCSASADTTLRVWTSTSAKTKFTLKGHCGIILSCNYTTDGACIISNDETQVRVWSTEDGSCQLSLTPEMLLGSPTFTTPYGEQRVGWTLSAAAPGGFTDYILVACNNRFVYVIDRRTGKEVFSMFCKAPVYCLSSGWNELVACGDKFGNIYMLRFLTTRFSLSLPVG